MQTFSCNDVHLELEGDEHDIIHVVIPPISFFKVVMMNLRMTKLKGLELEEDDCLKDEFAQSDVVEVADDARDAMYVAENDLAQDVEVKDDVVNLDVDSVVDRPDHKDDELYDVDVQKVVFLAVEVVVERVVDVEDEVVVVEGIPDDEKM